MSNVEAALDPADCVQLVTHYLAAQGWQLVDADRLAEEIWQELSAEESVGAPTGKAVQNQIWQRYAEILHAACRHADYDQQEQAWAELRHWLHKQARRLTADAKEQDDLAQTVAVGLQLHLSKAPLKAPRTLWAFVLQMMRRARIDEHRHDIALRRGGGKVLSLEEISETQENGDDSKWEEELPIPGQGERSVEDSVADEQAHQQLRAFFRQHLATDLQRTVAEAHFLDGLEPREIAQLMGKRPHEIRLVKARVVQTLRGLPPDERQKLLDILKAAGGGLAC